jgi:hypothetical protein
MFLIKNIILILFLFWASPSLVGRNIIIFKSAIELINNNTPKFYSNINYHKSLAELNNSTKNCTSILSLESVFMATFLKNSIKNYSIWIIPPFFDDNIYREIFKSGKIDCILISEDLQNSVGSATNIRLRYINYIKKYEYENINTKINIENYGYLLKINNE